MLTEEIRKNKELKHFLKTNILKVPYKISSPTIHESNKYSIHSLIGNSFDFISRTMLSPFDDTAISYMIKYLNPEFNSDDMSEIVEYNFLFNSALNSGFKKKDLKIVYNNIVSSLSDVNDWHSLKTKESLFSASLPDIANVPIESFFYLSMIRHVHFSQDFKLLNTIKRRDREIEDIRNLLPSIKTLLDSFDTGNVIFDHEFHSGSIVGGAECDILVNKDFIIDIKVVNSPIVTTYMLNQLVSYASLALLDGITIKRVGIYFARHEHLEIIEMKDIVKKLSDFSDFYSSYYNSDYKNIKFNKPQKEFIKLENPILSIAGPGSGKTETLIDKVSKQTINNSIHDILLLTFTTKAAREMSDRLESKIGPIADASNIGTFHSVFFKLLKINTYTDWDLILPGADMALFTKAIRKNTKIKEDEDVNKYTQNKFGARLYDLKNIPAQAIFKCIWKQKDIVDFAETKINVGFGKVISWYLNEKKRLGMMNFDDILRFALKTLLKNSFFREQTQNRFKTIFVDEFQDTNFIQFRILELISKNNNVVAVGDPYQSIYGFMNARLENVITFNETFNPTVVHMNINYRSTKNIVKMTNLVTDFFKQRIESSGLKMKELEAATPVEGEKIHLVSTNAREKATFNLICADIDNGINPKDIAVIIRKNRDSGKLERLLTKEGISFRKRSGSSFYERPEIQAVLNSFLFWINRSNYNSFRYFAQIFEGIGEETGDAIADLAEIKARTITSSFVADYSSDLKYKRKDEVIEVLDQLEQYPVGDFMDFNSLLSKFEILEKITAPMKSADEAETATENISDLLDDLEHLLDTKSFDKIEEELAVMLLSRSERDKFVDSLTITTAHSSKGLEWENVYIMDLSKHNFTECREDLFELNDEQIRLLYVSISRAKDRLILIHQNQLVTSKKIKPLDPIIEEIEEDNPDLFLRKILNY